MDNIADDEVNAARQPLILKRALIVYAIALLAALWAYQIWDSRRDRQATLASAEAQLVTIATALSAHVTAIINDGVGAADAGVNELVARGGTTHLGPQEMAATLQRMLTGGAYVRELFFVTPHHFVSATRSDATANRPRPPWADDFPTDAAIATWVGKPLLVQGYTEASIPIARRATADKDGNTWVGAIFSVSSLDRLYADLSFDQGTMTLMSTNGEILLSAPTNPKQTLVGRSIAATDVFKNFPVLGDAAVTRQLQSPLSGAQRLYAMRKIPNHPLVAVAGRDVAIALLPWRIRTQRSYELAGLSSLALLLLTTALYLVLNRRYQALRKSEERFQLAVAGSNDGIWDWDMKTNRVYYSPRLKEQLGANEPGAMPPVPDSFWQRVHPDDLPRVKLAVQQHVRHRDPYQVEYRVRARGDEYRWFRARAQATWNDRGQAVRMAGSIIDIHDKKMAKQALDNARAAELKTREEFAQSLLVAQEHERLRLANELHDSVGQTLSVIKNRALLALQQPGLSPSASEQITALSNLTSDVIAEVRAVARNLRPLHVEQLGITDALDTLLTQTQDASQLHIERRIENIDAVITGDAATHLFRIVQEALNNLLKHSRATQCRVKVERDVHCVRLVIADNGQGFDSTVASNKPGLGLASIAERVRILSAQYRVDTAPGQGTTLTVEIPIDGENDPSQ